MQKRYGHLVVIEEITQNGYKKYRCLCDCGRETIVHQSNLLVGRAQSCGCGNIKNRHCFKDFARRQFGELIALAPTKERSEGTIVWKRLCSCEKGTYASAKRLLRGDIKSCGCLNKKQYHIENKIFGNLIVIKALDKKMDWKTKW